MRRAVFLDRDGVLNESVMRDGVASPPASAAELRIYPDAAAALTSLQEAGFLLIVVTNQPDIARGKLTLADVENINALISAQLPIDEFRICPHDDRDGCACRKPKPGLLTEVATRLSINLSTSFMVGDRWRDVDAGAAAGCRTVLLERGHQERLPEHAPTLHTTTLESAASWILANFRCIS